MDEVHWLWIWLSRCKLQAFFRRQRHHDNLSWRFNKLVSSTAVDAVFSVIHYSNWRWNSMHSCDFFQKLDWKPCLDFAPRCRSGNKWSFDWRPRTIGRNFKCPNFTIRHNSDAWVQEPYSASRNSNCHHFCWVMCSRYPLKIWLSFYLRRHRGLYFLWHDSPPSLRRSLYPQKPCC